MEYHRLLQIKLWCQLRLEHHYIWLHRFLWVKNIEVQWMFGQLVWSYMYFYVAILLFKVNQHKYYKSKSKHLKLHFMKMIGQKFLMLPKILLSKCFKETQLRELPLTISSNTHGYKNKHQRLIYKRLKLGCKMLLLKS